MIITMVNRCLVFMVAWLLAVLASASATKQYSCLWLPMFVEVAETTRERAKGLSERYYLPRNAGMLFVFDKVAKRTFWMRNTYIPLEIANISQSGMIESIQPMQPYSLMPVASISKVKYALEANPGWFASHAIYVGDRIVSCDGLDDGLDV